MNKNLLFLITIFNKQNSMEGFYNPIDNFNKKFSDANDSQTNIYRFFIITGILISIAIITTSIMNFTKDIFISFITLILALLNIFGVFITTGFQCTIGALIKIFIILYSLLLGGFLSYKFIIDNENDPKNIFNIIDGGLDTSVGVIQLVMMIFYEKLILMN